MTEAEIEAAEEALIMDPHFLTPEEAESIRKAALYGITVAKNYRNRGPRFTPRELVL